MRQQEASREHWFTGPLRISERLTLKTLALTSALLTRQRRYSGMSAISSFVADTLCTTPRYFMTTFLRAISSSVPGNTFNPPSHVLDYFSLGNLFPLSKVFPSSPPPAVTTDPTLLNGQNVTYIASNYGRPGRTQNWTFEIQKQLAQDLILSVG